MVAKIAGLLRPYVASRQNHKRRYYAGGVLQCIPPTLLGRSPRLPKKYQCGFCGIGRLRPRSVGGELHEKLSRGEKFSDANRGRKDVSMSQNCQKSDFWIIATIVHLFSISRP